MCLTPPPLGWTVVLCPMFNQQSGRQVSYEWFHVRVKCRWETLTWVSDLKLSITSCRCCSSFTLSLRRASSCSVRSLSSFLLFSGISCRSASYGPTNIHHTLTVILWLLLQQNTAFPLQSLLFSVNSSISSHLALLSTLLFPSCFLTLLQTCAQSLLPRAMRCWGQPTVENSLGPAQMENATIHAVSVILRQMFEAICWSSCIGLLMTSVAGNLYRKSKRFVLWAYSSEAPLQTFVLKGAL